MVDILEYERRATGEHIVDGCGMDRTGVGRYLEWIKRAWAGGNHVVDGRV